MAGKLSGEALATNTKSLLGSLKGFLRPSREAQVRSELPILRRRANMENPPKQRAAEATRLHLLKEMIRRARRAKLEPMERQALDIFIVAFATVSRVGEIAALGVENVARDGSALALRPKTGARTWVRLTKRVTNAGGLEAADRLRMQREAAAKQGRTGVFADMKGRIPTTATITRRLKEVARKVGIEARITAHSARKGAAVEALLAGVPLPVIQALGGWRSLDTLQAYVGEALRRTTPLMDILEGKGEGGRTKVSTPTYNRTGKTVTSTWNEERGRRTKEKEVKANKNKTTGRTKCKEEGSRHKEA